MKKTSSQKAPATRRRRVLLDDACPTCGTNMGEKRGTLRLPVNGEEIRSCTQFTSAARSAQRSFSGSRTLNGFTRTRSRSTERSTGCCPPTRSTRSASGSVSRRRIWRACCDSERTQCPAGSRAETFRRPRWTCCSSSFAICRAASTIFGIAKPDLAARGTDLSPVETNVRAAQPSSQREELLEAIVREEARLAQLEAERAEARSRLAAFQAELAAVGAEEEIRVRPRPAAEWPVPKTPWRRSSCYAFSSGAGDVSRAWRPRIAREQCQAAVARFLN